MRSLRADLLSLVVVAIFLIVVLVVRLVNPEAGLGQGREKTASI